MFDVDAATKADYDKFKAEEGVAVETTPETVAPSTPEVEEVDDTDPYAFVIKGEKKKFSRGELVNRLSREETFQKKYNKLEQSDEYKYGLLLSKAKAGDKAAQKSLKDILGELNEGDVSKLDAVQDKFDLDDHVEKTLSSNKEEEVFEDIKDDVDFPETLSKIESDAKSRLPPVVFETYWKDPKARRVMYDLEKSGLSEQVYSGLQAELDGMTSRDRAAIKRDPEWFGDLIVEVLNSMSKPAAPQQETRPSSNLRTVSSGEGARHRDTDGEPDWANMTSEEFKLAEAKYLKRFGLRP